MTVTISWSPPGSIVSTTALPPDVTLYETRTSFSLSPCLPLPTHSPASLANRSRASDLASDFFSGSANPAGANAQSTAATDAMILPLMITTFAVRVLRIRHRVVGLIECQLRRHDNPSSPDHRYSGVGSVSESSRQSGSYAQPITRA